MHSLNGSSVGYRCLTRFQTTSPVVVPARMFWYSRCEALNYDSFLDALRQGFIVGLIVKLLYPHKNGPHG